MLAFLRITALFGVSKEAVYKVGDSAGRTMMDNVDYDNWASNKNFHAGDIIVTYTFLSFYCFFIVVGYVQ